MLVGEDLWKYLEERGVIRHEHTNGLMSCYECTEVVITGKHKDELKAEWAEKMKELAKEMGIDGQCSEQATGTKRGYMGNINGPGCDPDTE